MGKILNINVIMVRPNVKLRFDNKVFCSQIVPRYDTVGSNAALPKLKAGYQAHDVGDNKSYP